MTEPIDILDRKDPLALPFFASLVIHGAFVALLCVGWFWIERSHTRFGDVNAGGGPAFTVSPVHNIPIPRREAPPNPVAFDTQSMVPEAPTLPQKLPKPPPPPKNAVEIPQKNVPKPQRPQQQRHFVQPTSPNQVYSHIPRAMSNPMYGGPAGSGRVGIGPNTPLGDNRLGAYAGLIRDRIAQNWQTGGLDERSERAPAVVSFVILRDGSVREVRLMASSGNPNIDDTAIRAVYAASPFPPLPPQVFDSSITAQFTFSLR